MKVIFYDLRYILDPVIWLNIAPPPDFLGLL